jgi:hypothetical protein
MLLFLLKREAVILMAGVSFSHCLAFNAMLAGQ